MSSNFLISIGCNTQHESQMRRVRESLRRAFPDISFTNAVTSPAYGKENAASPYSNMLAEGTTQMSEMQFSRLLKKMETELGDTTELRQQELVMMDLDLMRFGEKRHHHDDWERPYIKTLLRLAFTLILFTLSFNAVISLAQDRKRDSELLGKAVEYYQGEKFHECILTFEKLQKSYRLNPRHMAYLGYSYYKEKKYPEAVNYLTKAIPELEAYSPKEQAIFLYSCGESLFHLGNYKDSRDYYQKALPFVEGTDKADVLYHTAFGLYLEENGEEAVPLFEEAIELYSKNSQPEDLMHKARCKQAQIMRNGIRKSLQKEEMPLMPSIESVNEEE